MKTSNQQKIDILALNRLKVLNEKNEEIVLSSLWKDHPAVIVFIRHFGCISCRSHVDQVWSKKDKIQLNGTKIYFIGSGSPYLISQFKIDCNLTDAKIFTDPTLESFKASGLIHTNTKVLDAASLKKIKELEAMGYSLKKIENDGDDTQLGGIVAMKPPGIVSFHFISQFIGDFEDQREGFIEE